MIGTQSQEASGVIEDRPKLAETLGCAPRTTCVSFTMTQGNTDSPGLGLHILAQWDQSISVVLFITEGTLITDVSNTLSLS